jgi:putative Ca2+/H+ antiporter (TMEM165/GDT1 family)
VDWKLLLSTFGIMFLAELGDKTQLTVFTLVTQSKRPLPVFIGSVLALTLVTLIGALFGQAITKFVPGNILRIAAGVLFLGIGIVVLWQALVSRSIAT